ncbi:MAG: hypothetical protein LBE92_03035 [Chryseobacterium sp.]|jgi:hypothetical protein|uniref:hypothetical protein n=1 Tax=Chryseobacterium sp. TaxID=1871047 RepID=UPI002823B00E|nr:hypothetical protein [Chryseobacterium sp.]MDR2235074.1 hypothetical protein [Chryseobacterium sp.]
MKQLIILYSLFYALLINAQNDCHKIYEQQKKDFESNISKLNKTDFSQLLDQIFISPEFEKAIQQKKAIFLLDIIPDSNHDVATDKDCPQFKGDLRSETFKRIWTIENYRQLQNKVKNIKIIPAGMIGGALEFGDQTEEMNFFSFKKITPKYSGEYIDRNKQPRPFYYSSENKPDKKLIIQEDKIYSNKDYLFFGLQIHNIEKTDCNNCYVVKIHLKESNTDYSKVNHYEFTGGKWVILK